MIDINEFEVELNNALEEIRDDAYALYNFIELFADADVGAECNTVINTIEHKKVKYVSSVYTVHNMLVLHFYGKVRLPEIPGYIRENLWVKCGRSRTEKINGQFDKKIIGGLRNFFYWFRFVDLCFYYDERCQGKYRMKYDDVEKILKKNRYDGVKWWGMLAGYFRDYLVDELYFRIQENISLKKGRFSRLKCVELLSLYKEIENDFCGCSQICCELNSAMYEDMKQECEWHLSTSGVDARIWDY